MAIDYGKKRTGIAVTDPLKMIASRLTTVASATVFDFLKTYLEKEDVETFVVGYPMTMNYVPSEAVKYIDPFVKKLQKIYPEIPVELADERFTSKLAFQTMIDAGVKKQQRRDKALIDGVSATIILQSYLDLLRHKNER